MHVQFCLSYCHICFALKQVKSSDVELQSDMDVPVPNYTSTRKLEVRSPDLEVPSAINATDEKMSLGSTCDKSKTTEEVSGIKQVTSSS